MIRRFNRFELKYVLHVSRRDALIDELGDSLHRDAHALGDGTYKVTSLYYDSPSLACFWAKLEGIKYRRKVRVRIYDTFADLADSVAMVEIKQRINRTVQKRRLVTTLDAAYALCDQGDRTTWDDTRDAAVAAEVEFLRRSLHLRPTCVITYQRRALVGGAYDPGLRVTFDMDLACRPPDRRLGTGVPTHRFFSPEFCIMEVKVNDAIPIWLSRLLARHGCDLRRISKYCAGVAQLQHLPTANFVATSGEQDG